MQQSYIAVNFNLAIFKRFEFVVKTSCVVFVACIPDTNKILPTPAVCLILNWTGVSN